MSLDIEKDLNQVEAPAILSVTDEALEQLRKIIAEEPEENLSLRVYIDGARAAMALDDVVRDGDITLEFSGLRVVVDPVSAPYLAGATIGYQDTLMNRGFTIENANLPQMGGCACGGNCGCGGH